MIHGPEGRTVFIGSVREAHKRTIPWCCKCPEFIPASADLSVGAGLEKGTCAVYLQTQRGLEIFEKACEDGVLVAADAPAKFRERFEMTSKQKRKKNQSK